jgi:5-methyltetrahydropteroyltriglutamate--homocysteine methyltransferase
MLFPTMLVGSYPQPDWLIDRGRLQSLIPPRVRAKELWLVAPEHLAQAQDDATRLAIHDQERAGIDILTDGEMRRESYSNHFATALDGIDIQNPGTALGRSGRPQPVPRIVGPIRRTRAVAVDDLSFLRAHTDRPVKMTVPGAFTMALQAQDDHYGDLRAVAMAYADALNDEIRDLFAAGADMVQIDEPYMQAHPDRARDIGLDVLERSLDSVEGETFVHICFGYAAMIRDKPSGYSFLPELAACSCTGISVETAQPRLDCSVLGELAGKKVALGVIDLGTNDVETPELVAERIERALRHVAAERIVVATDCGMKYLPRDVAFAKMQSMVEGARLMRNP